MFIVKVCLSMMMMAVVVVDENMCKYGEILKNLRRELREIVRRRMPNNSF